MARHSQRHRTTNLPFRYRSEGLRFDLEEYRLDGERSRQIDLAPGQTEIDIAPGTPTDHGSDQESWDRATLSGFLKVPESLPEDLFPPEERDTPPAKLYVAVRCHDTIYRDSVVVQETPTTPGEYAVRIRLDWENFRGRVELRPYLVRTEERKTDGPYATSRNVKVASGTRYEIVVDHWDDDAPPDIDGEEASFSQSPHLPGEDNLYYLDFRNEGRPKLWINSDHPRIADVLRSEGSVGTEPRFRDVILDQISYGVWSQLIVHAATAIDRDGDVEYEWQQTVLETFAPELCEVEDVEDAKHLLREEVRDPSGVSRLVRRIDTELQEFVDPRTQLINLMEEGLQI
jgi:hypothetical protein